MAASLLLSPSYRRPLLIYLTAIVGPTLVLLYLGLESVQRQQQAVAGLRATTLRLAGEQLAAELERRTARLAGESLRDSELRELRPAGGGGLVPEEAHRLRVIFERVAARHRVADQFFIIEGSTVQYPPLQAAPPRAIGEYLLREPTDRRGRLATLWREAEKLEIAEDRTQEALVLYRRSHELATSDPTKALALARVARCTRKLAGPAAAEKAYQTLADQYGTLYDPFHRPYALVATFERLDSPEVLARCTRLSEDLVGGRWDLSAEQADYFAEQLRHRLGPVMPAAASAAASTGYLRRFELARSLQERFRLQGSLRPGDVVAYALVDAGRSYQTFYTTGPPGVGPGSLLGVAVNLGWVQSTLLGQVQAESTLDRSVDGEVELTPITVPRGPAEARVGFTTLFPFWELRFRAAPGAPGGSPRRDVAIFAGSTLLILGVLIMGVVFLMRDVSREMQLGRLRADFVSGVSHELKTPLTLISLYAETLLDDERFRPNERRSFYEIILRESGRLTHLIENVLEFSRIDRGQKQYRVRVGDFRTLVARTVDVYGEYLRRRGFSVETALASALPPVRFDGDAVTQALLNLLDNASKYSGDAKFIRICLRASTSTVVLEVEDHGTGIPADEQSRIFDQFYRRHGDSGTGGYGLGLFLVNHIMKAHGGGVQLESQPGRGSCFRLIFPASASDVVTDEAEPR